MQVLPRAEGDTGQRRETGWFSWLGRALLRGTKRAAKAMLDICDFIATVVDILVFVLRLIWGVVRLIGGLFNN